MDHSYLKKKSLIFGVTLLFAISVVLFSLSLTGKTYAAGEADQSTKKNLNVTCTGTVQASPDIAYVSLGVVAEHADAKTAQQNNAKSMAAVVNEIKKAGVKSEDIKTTNFSIYPKTNYNQATGESKIIGYTVNNMVQITIRDITKVGTILDIAADNGSNVSNNITFGLSDYEKYYQEALKKAVTNAKGRADSMAGALNIHLKSPISITENGGYSPPIYNYAYSEMKGAVADNATPVEAGNMEIKATVNMTYEF